MFFSRLLIVLALVLVALTVFTFLLEGSVLGMAERLINRITAIEAGYLYVVVRPEGREVPVGPFIFYTTKPDWPGFSEAYLGELDSVRGVIKSYLILYGSGVFNVEDPNKLMAIKKVLGVPFITQQIGFNTYAIPSDLFKLGIVEDFFHLMAGEWPKGNELAASIVLKEAGFNEGDPINFSVAWSNGKTIPSTNLIISGFHSSEDEFIVEYEWLTELLKKELGLTELRGPYIIVLTDTVKPDKLNEISANVRNKLVQLLSSDGYRRFVVTVARSSEVNLEAWSDSLTKSLRSHRAVYYLSLGGLIAVGPFLGYLSVLRWRRELIMLHYLGWNRREMAKVLAPQLTLSYLIGVSIGVLFSTTIARTYASNITGTLPLQVMDLLPQEHLVTITSLLDSLALAAVSLLAAIVTILLVLRGVGRWRV